MENSFLISQSYKISRSFLSWVGRSPRAFEGLCKSQEMPHQPRAWSEAFSTDCPSPWAGKPAACSTRPKVRWTINKKYPKSKNKPVKLTIFYNKHRSFHRNHRKTHFLSLLNREKTWERKQRVCSFGLELAGAASRLGFFLVPEEGSDHPTAGCLWERHSWDVMTK